MSIELIRNQRDKNSAELYATPTARVTVLICFHGNHTVQ